MASSIGEPSEYTIRGVPVKFPCKPYRTQIAMMSKIVQALTKREHALLESPTGSGKSLALLCSTLAWQHLERQRQSVAPPSTEAQATNCPCECHVKVESQPPAAVPPPAQLTTTDASTTAPDCGTPAQHAQSSNAPVDRMLGGSMSNQLDRKPDLQPYPCSAGLSACSSSVCLPGNCPDTSVLNQTVPHKTGNDDLAVSSMETPARRSSHCNPVDLHASTSGGVAQKPGQISNLKKQPSLGSADATGRPQKAKSDGSGGKKCVSCPGEGGEAMEVAEEGSKLNEPLDDDFKQSKKRFRTPSTSRPGKKKKKVKGAVYEDGSDSASGGEDPNLCVDERGLPTWKIELKGEAATAGLGVNQSQIMDTGVDGNSGACGGKTKTCDDATDNPAPNPAPNPGPAAPCPKCGCGDPTAARAQNLPNKRKSPRIYFGTRTHKQISQLTHEMGKTVYSGTPMCILASREHTCVHPKVSLSRSKNDDCKRLLDYADGVSCSFFHRVQQKLGSQAQLRQLGYTTAWDIEDLVQLGKKTRACPYFATRGLLDEADIVFCPYNYLIDPMIREQMMVELSEQVVVLDEAHNMEDSAREAASVSVTSLQILDVVGEIEEICEGLQHLLSPCTSCKPSSGPDIRQLITAYKHIQAMCKSMVRWIDNMAQRLPQRAFEQACGIWSGQDFLPVLEQFGVTPATFVIIQSYLKVIVEASSDVEPFITGTSLNLIKSVCMVIGFLFKDNMKFIHDYRMSLMKTATKRKDTKSRGGWRQRKPKAAEKVWTYSLNFWCLNPAVAFSELTRARSIILTSGTLSPMGSFSSELGVSFSIQLEANHVIPESQTWIRSLSCGPHGKTLTANYQNTETYDFQDELGELILRVCQTVPFGVLCFLPSYKVLEKLTKRWQDTMLWDRVMKEKYIVSEPRSGEKIDFDALMSKFYDIIRESHPPPEEGDSECLTGALFLAVCRGKVSEGLDFADNHARAVITVGIPFPNIKDKQVELKREYNNEHTHQRGLLTGSEWYEIQAYRALNQALGRCIRHKKDWGALILVDERFGKGMHYTKGLSKWVRQRLHHQSNFNQAMGSLHSFAEAMMKADAASVDASTNTHTSLLEKSPRPSLSTSALATSPSDTPLKSPLLRDSLSPRPHPLSSPSAGSTYVAPITSTPIAVRGERVAGKDFSGSASPAVASMPLAANAPEARYLPQGNSVAFVPCASSLQQSFLYPGGIPIASPNSKPLALISLTDISRVAMQLPLNMEGVESANSADGRRGNGEREKVASNQKGLQKPDFIRIRPSTTVPETPDQSPSIKSHSPLLFDSCDSNPETPPVVAPKQTAIMSMLSQFKYMPKNPTRSSNLWEQVLTPAVPPTGQLSISGEQCAVPGMSQTPQKPEASDERCHSTLVAVDRDITYVENQLRNQTMTQPLTCPGRHSPQDCHGETLPYDADADMVDDDLTPPLSLTSNLNPMEGNSVAMSTDSDIPGVDLTAWGDEKMSRELQTSKHLGSENKSDVKLLGQPRRNVRMSTRRTAASTSAAEPLSVSESEDEDAANSKTKSVGSSRAGSDSNQVVSRSISCSCGKLLSKYPVAAERMELKEALSKQLASFKVHTIQTSRLWRDLRSGQQQQQRRKGIPVYVVAASDLSFSIREGTSEYNAMWDEKLELCYSRLQCTKCGVTVGASVHCMKKDRGTLKTLIGKAILVAERVSH